MNGNSKKYYFIDYTCSWATKNPNGLDWIRTAYFSLLTGVLFLFAQKISTLSSISIILFFISILFFLIGGLSSGWIVTRFKKHEKEHDKQPQQEMKKKTSVVFFYERETLLKNPIQLKLIRFQHLSFYFVWMIALLSIGISFAIEQKPNTEIIVLEQNNEILTQQKDSLIQIISKNEIETKIHQDSLNTDAIKLDLQTKQIDSLENVIHSLKHHIPKTESQHKKKIH
jgi:hypothetical protein